MGIFLAQQCNYLWDDLKRNNFFVLQKMDGVGKTKVAMPEMAIFIRRSRLPDSHWL